MKRKWIGIPRNRRRRRLGAVCSMVMVGSLLLSGCQENPESSIVVNKDMDNLIEQAGNTEQGITNVAEVAENYDSYQVSLKDDSLHVSVNVDAKVDIPEVDSLSVFRVEQQKITQELADKMIQVFMGEESLYDGSAQHTRTRKEIEADIRRVQDAMKEADDDYKNEYQYEINHFQEEYENSPEDIIWEEYRSDGKLHSIDELNQKYPSHTYYSWQKELETDELLYVITHEGTDEQKELYIMNNAARGNAIRYIRKSAKEMDRYNGFISDISAGYLFATNLEAKEHLGNKAYPYSTWRAEDGIPENLDQQIGIDTKTPIAEDVSSAPTTISLEEACTIAEDFLEKVGITDFGYYTGGKYKEVSSFQQGRLAYNTYYILQYTRTVDNAMVTMDRVSKHEEGWTGDSYVKKDWPIECMEFRINDDGIVAFNYNAPLAITETVVDRAAVKSFDSVKDTFEKMVLIKYATTDEQMDDKTIDIDRVVLGYARVSEADSYDTGLLVPVWDFKGTIKRNYVNRDEEYGSILTINAIDGSVMDRSLGY